jgi:hypothetical protein
MKGFITLVFLTASLLSVPPLGAQSFNNPYRIPTTADPITVYVVDVNGDGLPDILYGDDTSIPSIIHVLLAQPTGGYLPGPPLVLPDNVGPDCRTLDANGDGKVDLVCIQLIDDFDVAIATFLGNGDGTFQAPIYSGQMQSYNFAFMPWIFSPADLNGDSIPDLIVHDRLDGFSYVLLGDGTGRFTVTSTVNDIITTIGSYGDLDYFVMDLNGDGKADLVSSNGPIVYLGNGDGTFQQGTGYGDNFSCVYHDMEGDGHPDAVCGALGTDSFGDANGNTDLIILHGNPDGSFNTTPILTNSYGNGTGGQGTFIAPLAIADLNGDGIPDILAYSSDGFSVLLGQPHLSFLNPVHYAVGYLAGMGELSSQFADLNKDGTLDVVACGPNGIYISYGIKDGTFNAPPAYEVADVVGHVTVADFNGDGIPDIAATGDQSIELSLGSGDGTFKPFTALPNGGIDFGTGGMAGFAQIVHGDFRGVGKKDILAIGSPSIYVYNSYILFGNGDGTFASPQLVPDSSVIYPAYDTMAVVDINDDGRDDILTKDAGHIYVALSNGDGTFTTVTTPIPNASPDVPVGTPVPALADFSHSGKLDAAYAVANNVYVLKGHGDGSFDSTGVNLLLPTYQDQSPEDQVALTTGDFDGDGNPDIAVLAQVETGQNATVAFVYYGNGDGTFSSPVVAGTFNRNYTGIYAADLSKNGRSDLILQTYGVVGVETAPSGDALGVVMSLPGRLFGPEVNYTGGASESALVVADFNGDGYLDLLAVNSGFYPNGDYSSLPGNSVTELLNLGPQTAPAGVATTTALGASSNTVPAGTPIVFTATVTSSTPGAGTPTGSVIFIDQMGIRTSVPLIPVSSSAASATLTTSSIGIGSDVMSATYSGDSTFAPSTAQVSLTVSGYPVSVSLTAVPNPSSVDEQVVFSITIANPPGSSAAGPAGYVELLDGLTIIGGPTLVTNAAATMPSNFLVPGLHQITASYSGDAAHVSNSASLTETILATPTVTAIPSSYSINIAQALTVTVAVSSTGNPTPTGSVMVTSGSFTSATTTLSNGSAIITIPAGTLPMGNDTLTANYTPDAGSSAIYTSASSTTNVAVTPPPPSFAITATSVTISPGATTGNTSTVTVTPSNGFTGSVALTAALTSSPAGAQDLPALSFFSTSPVSITGTSAGNAILSIYTTAPTKAALAHPKRHGVPWYEAGGAMLACLLLFGFPARRRNWRTMFGMVALLVILAGGVLSCGGGGGGGGGGTANPGTTPGTYIITVTGTSGSTTATGTLTLIV